MILASKQIYFEDEVKVYDNRDTFSLEDTFSLDEMFKTEDNIISIDFF